jgi:CHAT domain-containing protein
MHRLVRWAAVLGASCCMAVPALAGGADRAAQVDRLAASAFCSIVPASPVPAYTDAIALYRANRPREAAASAAAIVAATDDASQRLAAVTLQARALKVMACDEPAMRVLADALLAAEGAASLAMPRCLAQGRLARLMATRNLDAADELALRTLACASPQGPDDAASEAHTTRAIAALARSAYPAAEVELRLADERAASSLARSEALRVRGSLLLRLHPDPAAARPAFDDSVAAAREAGDPEALAIALIQAGYARPPAALDAEPAPPEAEAGMALATAGELRRVIALRWQLQGQRLLERQTGRAVADAASLLGDGATLYGAIGDRSQERSLRLQLGGSQVRLGDYAAARPNLLRARDLALDSGLVREAAKSDQMLGTIARLSDPPDLPFAHASLTQAVAGLQASGDEPDDVARALAELAAVESRQGLADAASGHLAEAVTLALRRADPAQLASLYANLGWVAWQRESGAEAHAAWRAALGSPNSRPEAQALAWWGLARMAAPAAPAVAAGRYARAVQEVERMRPAESDVDATARGAFDRRFSDLYREYAALLVGLGQYAQAHRMALLTQRQELVEMRWSGTRDGPTAITGSGFPAGDEPLDACPPVLAAREQRMRTLWSEQSGLRTTEREACCRNDSDAPAPGGTCAADSALPRYCALRNEVRREQRALLRDQADCVAQVQEAARRAERSEIEFALPEAFIDAWSKATEGQPVYLVVTIADGQRLHVLVRAPDDPSYRVRTQAVPSARLEALTQALHSAWEAVAGQRVRLSARALEGPLAADAARLRATALRELNDLIFGGFDPPALPASPANGATVAFVLDRLLRDVPMAALFDGRQFLGERFAIVLVTPSSTAAGPPPDSAGAALVMGVSEPDLPHVEREVAQVATLLQTTPYLNQQSTRRRVVDWLENLGPGQRALALHLASHATMGGTKASSQVRLWGEDRLNGLDLDDLRDRLRRVQLVVFSACRSASAGGDLALGLAGLAERGARSVVGSLWSVDDASTSRLMGAFYGAWRREPRIGVAQALAVAQRELLATREFAHPYFWAPFGVVGRWD